MNELQNKRVAILSDNGFEEEELTSPKAALEEAGATVHIVSMQDSIKGWKHDHWSIELSTDVSLDEANESDYDALMIPGGVINPDFMRTQPEYVRFATAFMESGKPVAAICHAPQLLIETGHLKGRKLTSYPSIKTDLINAGADWQDEEVIADFGLVTSRSPKDLPAFNRKMVEEIAEGVHATSSSQSPVY